MIGSRRRPIATVNELDLAPYDEKTIACVTILLNLLMNLLP